MEFFSLAEIMTAVVMVLGGQKGFEIYKRKRFANGNGHERRRNSFADSDKDFIQECFKNQTKEMGTTMENDRLKLIMGLKEVVQNEGEKTRSVVRSSR